MQTKMMFLCFLFLATFQSVSANCRNIRCYAKTGTSLTSSNILNWRYRTCAFPSLSCTRAHGRVPSRCNNGDKKKEACSKACGSSSSCEKTIYLTGKADCKGNTLDPNAWMHPKKICCAKHPYFTGGKAVALRKKHVPRLVEVHLPVKRPFT